MIFSGGNNSWTFCPPDNRIAIQGPPVPSEDNLWLLQTNDDPVSSYPEMRSARQAAMRWWLQNSNGPFASLVQAASEVTSEVTADFRSILDTVIDGRTPADVLGDFVQENLRTLAAVQPHQGLECKPPSICSGSTGWPSAGWPRRRGGKRSAGIRWTVKWLAA